MTTRAYRSNSNVQTPNLRHDNHDRPIHFFQYKTHDFLYDLRQCPSERRFSETNFAQKLRSQWDESQQRGAINYDLNCMYKLLDGDFNFSMQLNVERATMRRKPMRFQSICQPFNSHRWNFTKLKAQEILFYIRCSDRPISDDPLDQHALCVNASPLERGHSLLVPSLSKCLPQIMNETGIRIAVDFMLLVEDENFHVLYNSLLGQASVNHLHLHTIFWPYESDLIYRRFELVAAKCFVIRRPNWFISTIAYQLTGPDDFDRFVKIIARTLNFLTRRNVAHNIFFTRAPPIRTDGELRDSRVNDRPQLVTCYVIPRRCHTGAKPMNNFNPAALELSGCLTAYTYRFFDSCTEQTALRIFDEDAVLEDENFEQLIVELAERLDGRVQWSAPMAIPRAVEINRPVDEVEELKDSFHTFSRSTEESAGVRRSRTHTVDPALLK
ncbi:hypothetical protein M3Y95_01035100 [Aphelenchoides besseyi]|nr:hypothetical protein M3Y95_01035100 [Aphelenchoides besseyi]